MSIDAGQLRRYVIRPALEAIGLWSLAAEELVLGTACQESECGRFLDQVDRAEAPGPAFGIFQMEAATHADIWHNFLAFKPALARKVSALNVPGMADAQELVGNLYYAAAMCRIHYQRAPERLPGAGNLNAQAHYWKDHYNTARGAGTVQQYVANWNHFVARGD